MSKLIQVDSYTLHLAARQARSHAIIDAVGALLRLFRHTSWALAEAPVRR